MSARPNPAAAKPLQQGCVRLVGLGEFRSGTDDRVGRFDENSIFARCWDGAIGQGKFAFTRKTQQGLHLRHFALRFNRLKNAAMIKPYVVPTGRRVLAMMIDAQSVSPSRAYIRCSAFANGIISAILRVLRKKQFQ